MRTTRTTQLTAIMLLAAITMPLVACGENNSGGIAQTQVPSSQTQGSELPEDSTAGNAPKPGKGAGKEAAEQYRDCLNENGVPADIVDGDRVVFRVEDPHSGSAGSDAKDTDRDVAIGQCQTQVPDYHDPDFNSK
ncbi:MAG: hypothetical protein LKG12_03620 [Bifidobacterium tibiigranuli]|jgi:hypothetical protein|nr:hypothetical protein [Bifidobacterium tibiigranuli]